MTALATDRIWTTRPGVSPPAGTAANYLTIQDIADGFATDAIANTAISGLTAAITAAETAFAATSADGTLNITGGGTNGHTPDLSVDFTQAPAASVPVASINGLAGAITAGETTFAAASADSSITITAGGTSGHTPDLVVNWGGISAAGATALGGAFGADDIAQTAIDFTNANTDGAFDTAVKASETTTSLAYNAGTTTLTYTDEAGAATNINLSALTSDIYITGATFAGTTLTLTDNDAGTADVTVDLAAFSSSFTDNSDGTYLLTAGDGSTQTIDTRASSNPITDAGGFFTGTTVEAALQELGGAGGTVVVSADANNDITAGGDGGAFLDISASETTTSLSQAAATGIITYTDEDGAAAAANVISTQANNIVVAGTDGGSFLQAPTTQLP